MFAILQGLLEHARRTLFLLVIFYWKSFPVVVYCRVIIYVIETKCAWADVVVRGRHGDVVSTPMGAGTSDVAMYLWGANRRRCNGVPPLPNLCQTFVRFRRGNNALSHSVHLRTINIATSRFGSVRRNHCHQSPIRCQFSRYDA